MLPLEVLKDKDQKFKDSEGLIKCFVPLLKALGWHGDNAQIFEMLPPRAIGVTVDEFVNVMANLRYRTRIFRKRLGEIDSGMLPCVFVDRAGTCRVIVEKEEGKFQTFNGCTEKYEALQLKRQPGLVLCFRKLDATDSTLLEKQNNWFSVLSRRFHRAAGWATMLSCIITLLGVVAPLIVMGFYGQIGPMGSSKTVMMMTGGVLLYLLIVGRLRFYRSSILAYLASRLGYVVRNEVLRRILYLPVALTENAPVSAQVARLRDFDSIQDFVRSPAAIALMELPFLLLLVVALFAIGGVIGLVPLASVLVFVLVGLVMHHYVDVKSEESVRLHREFSDFSISSMAQLREVKSLHLLDYWSNRYSELCRLSTIAHLQHDRSLNFISAVSSAIISMAGIMTMAIGVERVFSGAMAPAALMGTMMLTWRILGPMRTSFMAVVQVGKVRKSVAQLDRLMAIPLEDGGQGASSQQQALEGHIALSQVSFRYGQESYPALLGVNFEMKAGEILVITGHGGSGKSSILRLILGMYHPQTGRVLVDNLNIRQLDSKNLRRQIAYLPERTNFLQGTIRENFFLADPIAGEDDIWSALQEVGLEDAVRKMPLGLDTPLTGVGMAPMTASARRHLCLAFLYLKLSPIWLLDNPSLGMDVDEVTRLKARIKAQKGNSTVVLATQDVSFLEIADKGLLLNGGRMLYFGTGAEVLAKCRKAA